jgi:hypothetical protein
MISSDRFGGRGTTAGSRVQIGSAVEAETGTVLPAQQEARGYGERHLFPDDVPNIDVRRPFQKRVEIGVVSRLGIRAEHRGVDLDVDIGPYSRQAAPAFSLQRSVDMAPPEILSGAGCLQLPGHRHRPAQIEIQSFKGGIVRPKLPHRSHRSPLKVPDVHSQHSRLK